MKNNDTTSNHFIESPIIRSGELSVYPREYMRREDHICKVFKEDTLNSCQAKWLFADRYHALSDGRIAETTYQ